MIEAHASLKPLSHFLSALPQASSWESFLLQQAEKKQEKKSKKAQLKLVRNLKKFINKSQENQHRE